MSARYGLITPSLDETCLLRAVNSFSFLPTPTTVEPLLANRNAAARPIPLLAPVTITILPCINKYRRLILELRIAMNAKLWQTRIQVRLTVSRHKKAAFINSRIELGKYSFNY